MQADVYIYMEKLKFWAFVMWACLKPLSFEISVCKLSWNWRLVCDAWTCLDKMGVKDRCGGGTVFSWCFYQRFLGGNRGLCIEFKMTNTLRMHTHTHTLHQRKVFFSFLHLMSKNSDYLTLQYLYASLKIVANAYSGRFGKRSRIFCLYKPNCLQILKSL